MDRRAPAEAPRRSREHVAFLGKGYAAEQKIGQSVCNFCIRERAYLKSGASQSRTCPEPLDTKNRPALRPSGFISESVPRALKLIRRARQSFKSGSYTFLRRRKTSLRGAACKNTGLSPLRKQWRPLAHKVSFAETLSIGSSLAMESPRGKPRRIAGT